VHRLALGGQDSKYPPSLIGGLSVDAALGVEEWAVTQTYRTLRVPERCRFGRRGDRVVLPGLSPDPDQSCARRGTW